MALADIDTIVIAMLENRSFDHLLGYLSLPGANGPPGLEGLKVDPSWRATVANRLDDGRTFEPELVAPNAVAVDDPPHDQASIAMQIATPALGTPNMGGFVKSYLEFSKTPPTNPSAVMRYHDQKTVPVFDFLARNFCVCDHWFAALPLGTQANRLMAMAGESHLIDNSGLLLPEQPLVYDWLTNNNVTWCAYQAGNFLPFFSLMARWLPEITTSLTLSALGGKGGRFRRYARFKKEWQAQGAVPGVIYVEPEYTDGPHKAPNDDHPPTEVGPGQILLGDLYATLTSNPARWAKTLLIVTYDEHGGFFDHVPPLAIDCTIGSHQIATTGVRVPAFLVSPHVKPGSVFHGPLDHSSILQLLADRFGDGLSYSPAVDRRQGSLDRIAHALTESVMDTIPQMPALPAIQQAAAAAIRRDSVAAPLPAFATPNATALDLAARKFAGDHPELVEHPVWKDLRTYIATVPTPEAAPVVLTESVHR
jgi:phospholipase C